MLFRSEESEKAKKELSTTQKTHISMPFISANESGPVHLEMDLTRAKFNELTKDLVQRTLKPVQDALKDAGLTAKDIDEILLVGGSTRIPAVQELIKNEIGKEPNKSVNPDEVVAMGAAIQGGVLAGDVSDLVLLDVTPLSLGLETMGGLYDVVIERNTTIPTSNKKVYTTAVDNQPAVDIHVLQGERKMAADNKTLGRFQLGDIPPAKRGVPQIEVTFSIDANGIVSITAKDLGTGKEQSITITSDTNLTEAEIEQMVKDAEANAEADKKRKEEVETLNLAEQTMYAIDQTLEDAKEFVEDSEKETLLKLKDEMKNLLDAEEKDIEAIKNKETEISQAIQPIVAKMYQKASEQAQQETTDAPKDDVVDAEVEE